MAILNEIYSYIDQCFEMQDLNADDPEQEEIQSFEYANTLVANEWTQKHNQQIESLLLK